MIVHRLKSRLKEIVRSSFAQNNLFRWLCRDRVFVFLYHDVSDHPSPFSKKHGLNVPPEVFKRQIETIAQNFSIIGPRKLLSGDFSLPAALITFDDGMPSYFEEALPILRAASCPSLIFLNAEPIKGGYFWAALADFLWNHDEDFSSWLTKNQLRPSREPGFLFLTPTVVQRYLQEVPLPTEKAARLREYCGAFATPDELEACRHDPLVFFGNHLYNHYNAATLSAEELRAAYRSNEEFLSEYPNYLPFFAYPFGQPNLCFNEGTHRTILELGAQRIFLGSQLFNKKDALYLHRINMTESIADDRELKFRTTFPPVMAGLQGHSATPAYV